LTQLLTSGSLWFCVGALDVVAVMGGSPVMRVKADTDAGWW
jgi:hypothetical protein